MDGRNVNELDEETTIVDTDNLLIGKDNALKRVYFANVKKCLWNILNVAENLVTSAKNGLMSSLDKNKLDAIDTSLQGKTVSDTLTDNSNDIPSGKAITEKFNSYSTTDAVNSTINNLLAEKPNFSDIVLKKGYNDTPAKDIYDLMKNKLNYWDENLQDREAIFDTGGWWNQSWGGGIFFKLGEGFSFGLYFSSNDGGTLIAGTKVGENWNTKIINK